MEYLKNEVNEFLDKSIKKLSFEGIDDKVKYLTELKNAITKSVNNKFNNYIRDLKYNSVTAIDKIEFTRLPSGEVFEFDLVSNFKVNDRTIYFDTSFDFEDELNDGHFNVKVYVKMTNVKFGYKTDHCFDYGRYSLIKTSKYMSNSLEIPNVTYVLGKELERD